MTLPRIYTAAAVDEIFDARPPQEKHGAIERCGFLRCHLTGCTSAHRREGTERYSSQKAASPRGSVMTPNV
jgi:hypothetical protein